MKQNWPFKNIYLSGFMGSGKTSVAYELAKLIDWRFIDLDQLIESKNQQSISKIFQQKGEAFFRNQETIFLRKVSQENNQVISLGGGAILSFTNRDFIQKNGLWINLNVPLSVVQKRIESDSKRPLANSKNKNHLANLLRKRAPYYLQAPLKIMAYPQNPKALAQKICRLLR